jgi:4-hydroxy-tetrahydrodipicolinate reductase
MISVCLWGENGRMGSEVTQAVSRVSSFSSQIKLEALSPQTAGVIDFSSANGLLDLLKKLSDEKSNAWVVSGSTGLTTTQKTELAEYAKSRPILWAANFSLGVFALSRLLSAASQLPELRTFVAHIKEIHHIHKKDAPSGTALLLKKYLPDETKIESIRRGEVIGEHEVWFESSAERLGLIHEAKKRAVFAEGAIESAILLTQKLKKNHNSLPKRLLDLQDVFSS